VKLLAVLRTGKNFQNLWKKNPNSWEENSKPMEAKSKIFSFHESRFFNELWANPNICASLLSEPDAFAASFEPSHLDPAISQNSTIF